ncbi:MAG: helix-turn-helix domain-containing protein [Caldilinea sp. CFX5]|nr:helix-turn-helix domain-containing protein [Caldilinea sp. CFX5]
MARSAPAKHDVIATITTFGDLLRYLRQRAQLTQRDLALAVGYSISQISRLEHNERLPDELTLLSVFVPALGLEGEQKAVEHLLSLARRARSGNVASPVPSTTSHTIAKHDLAVPHPTPRLTSLHAGRPAVDAYLSADVEASLFVARKQELAQLETFLNKALIGQGQVAFVVGEAGSGKTALVQEFARRAQEAHSHLVVASGNCNAYSGIGDPYLPFREILALLVGDVEVRSGTGVLSQRYTHRLAELVPHTIQSIMAAGPDLIDVFIASKVLMARANDIALSYAEIVTRLKATLERQTSRRRTTDLQQQGLFVQYMQVLQTISQGWPMLLLLDDLQWADDGSLSLLFHLGRHLQGCRLLVVGIYRPDDVALGRGGGRHPLESVVNELRTTFGQIQIDLAQADKHHFINALLDSQPNRFGNEFRHALWRQTGGNALFTVEMLRDLQEGGDLVQDEQGYWREGLTLDWKTLPARVEGVISERLGRLPAALQTALQVASVEGEVFTAEVVAQIEQVERRELVRRLSGEVSKQHGLVQEQGSQQLGSQRLSIYRFHHILFQKYLYNRLDQVERVYLHEAVGQTLEALHRNQPGEMAAIAGQLAYHFQAAGLVRKAVDYLTLAGEQAVRVVAYLEASRHFSQALTQLAMLPETTERVQRELALLFSLGAVLVARKGLGDPEVAVTYSRIRDLLPKLGQDPQIFPALVTLERFYVVRGEGRLQYEMAVHAWQLAQATQDPKLLVGGHQVMGTALLFIGQFAAARAHLEQSLALYDPKEEYTFILPDDPGVVAGNFLGLSLWRLGFADQALLRFQEALKLAQGFTNRPYPETIVLCFLAMLHQWRRDAPAAQQAAEACIELATKHGPASLEEAARAFYGWALAAQGDLAAGIAQMQRGIAVTRMMKFMLNLPSMLALLAETYGKAGQVEEGLSLVAEALEMGATIYWTHTELHLLRGTLQLQQIDGEQAAEASFQRAIAIAREQEAKIMELRATVQLARLWRTQGKSLEARQMLAECYGWFSEGFDSVDLREAKSLLDQLQMSGA